jgi:hypothetical protein
MEIIADGENLLNVWKRNHTVIYVEITVGHVSMKFTGQLVHYSGIELILSQTEGELSISLFCGKYRVFEPSDDNLTSEHWIKYRRTIQITTDGGAVCTLHEQR